MNQVLLRVRDGAGGWQPSCNDAGPASFPTRASKRMRTFLMESCIFWRCDSRTNLELSNLAISVLNRLTDMNSVTQAHNWCVWVCVLAGWGFGRVKGGG